MAECQRERPIRDFVYSAMEKDNAWASAHLAVIDMTVTDDSLFNLITKFRSHMKMMASRKLHHSTHSAFSASAQPQENQNPTNQNHSTNRNEGNRGRDRGRGGYETSFRSVNQPSECLCGVIHWWREYPYLNPVKRPTNWKADVETKKRVDEELKNEEFRRKIDQSFKGHNDFFQRKNLPDAPKSSDQQKNQPNQSNSSDQ